MIATLYLDSSPVARFVAYSLHKVYVQTHVVNCYVLFLFRNNTLNKKHIIRDTSYMIHDTECIMHHTYFIYIYTYSVNIYIYIQHKYVYTHCLLFANPSSLSAKGCRFVCGQSTLLGYHCCITYTFDV